MKKFIAICDPANPRVLNIHTASDNDFAIAFPFAGHGYSAEIKKDIMSIVYTEDEEIANEQLRLFKENLPDSKGYVITGFLGDTFRTQSRDVLYAWVSGALSTLYAFAVNRDGRMEVGSTGMLYNSARVKILTQYREQTGEDYIE